MEFKNTYDLEDKINLIYNYLYNINSKNCFSFDKITLGKIGMDDIKISMVSSDDDKDSIDFYNVTKKEILDGRFKLINYNKDTNQVLLKKYSNQFPITIKVSFYPTEKEINSFDSPINNDSLFSYLLSQLVLGKKTKHILLPIMNFDAKLSDIQTIIPDEVVQLIKEEINSGKITEYCCLQLREHFFRTENLEEYLKSNSCCSYKILLFQIIHTLSIIQNDFPDFRHNNLTTDNIMIYRKKDSDSYTEYIGINDEKYYLPNKGFDIKIGNFDLSILPKFYGLANTSNKKIKFADKPNAYYDLFIFLNDLLESSTLMSSDNNKCDSETKKFLDKIIPPHMRGLSLDKFNKNIIIASPNQLLSDSYFDEFKNKPSKNSVEETLTNHQYLTGRFNTFMDSDNYSILGNQDKIKSNSNIMNGKMSSRKLKSDNETENKIIRKNMSGKSNEDSVEIKQKDNSNSQKKNTRTIRTELIGGSTEVGPFRPEKNTPFVSNDQRETFKKKSAEAPPKEPPVLLEQKLYDTSKKPEAKPTFPQTFIPLYDPEGMAINNLLPYSKMVNQPPVQKVYNVSLTNPLSGHTMLSRVYEDVLPGDKFNFSSLTIHERKQLIDFLRNNILETGDGEEMEITGGTNSLLSHIKIMDLNPYSLKKNPYAELPRNFLLYRAGYPIRLDEKTKNPTIAKSAMGLHVRIYKMSIGDVRCQTINKNLNMNNFDLWREVRYYNWVKEDILKKKISPNFIAPILYKIDSKSKINWNQLEVIRQRGASKEATLELVQNEQLINKKHDLSKTALGLYSFLLPQSFREVKSIDIELKDPKKTITISDKGDLTIDSGKSLILITEAPTTSLIQWSSPIYETFGAVKKMIATGYHSAEVWKSVLFQFVYAFAVLQEEQVYFNNMTFEDNIYIKDIFANLDSIGSWVYKVGSIDFYIPNYGYILMIDSKYNDIPTNDSIIKKESTEKEYKIQGKLYDEKTDYRIIIREQFRRMIDPDNFTQVLKTKGGSKPDDSIIDLLNRMYKDSEDEIKKYLIKYFGEFVHNRIGSLLNKSERDNINIISKPNFVKGNLMAWQKKYQEYEWVIYIGESTNPLQKQILVKEGNNFVTKDVFTATLFSYPDNEIILPESRNNFKYDENHIYERYNLDDLVKK